MNLRDVRAAMLPRSLRSQFIWAAVVLAVLIATCGITAVYALRASTSATRLLANDQLVLMDVAHELVQQTLLIERESSQLETAGSVETTRASYADILKQLEAFDHLSGRLAAANNDVSVLDLHQSSQLFRNTVNIVAQLRESQLGSMTRAFRLLRIMGRESPGQRPALKRSTTGSAKRCAGRQPSWWNPPSFNQTVTRATFRRRCSGWPTRRLAISAGSPR